MWRELDCRPVMLPCIREALHVAVITGQIRAHAGCYSCLLLLDLVPVAHATI